MARHVRGNPYALAPRGRRHPQARAAAPAYTPPTDIAYTTPTSAPPGSFDPALEAQRENADQGYGYAAQDFDLNKQRLLNDYTTQLTAANTQHSRSLADLIKSFANLAASQGDAQARAGVDMGGAAAQAATKRQANESLAQGRLDSDWRTLVGNLGVQKERGLAGLSTDFQRAGATNNLFNSQITNEEIYQAEQAGRLPTPGPGQAIHPTTPAGAALYPGPHSPHFGGAPAAPHVFGGHVPAGGFHPLAPSRRRRRLY